MRVPGTARGSRCHGDRPGGPEKQNLHAEGQRLPQGLQVADLQALNGNGSKRLPRDDREMIEEARMDRKTNVAAAEVQENDGVGYRG